MKKTYMIALVASILATSSLISKQAYVQLPFPTEPKEMFGTLFDYIKSAKPRKVVITPEKEPKAEKLPKVKKEKKKKEKKEKKPKQVEITNYDKFVKPTKPTKPTKLGKQGEKGEKGDKGEKGERGEFARLERNFKSFTLDSIESHLFGALPFDESSTYPQYEGIYLFNWTMSFQNSTELSVEVGILFKINDELKQEQYLTIAPFGHGSISGFAVGKDEPFELICNPMAPIKVINPALCMYQIGE